MSIRNILESILLMIPLVLVIVYLVIQNPFILKIVANVVLATISVYMFFTGINKLMTKTNEVK